jgi:deoxyadenosine/deoxycytidine kinase
LLRRIAERGREEERGITASFLRGLNAYYETFAEVAQRKYGLDVLVVDVTNLDIRQEPGRTQFIEQCVSFLDRPDARGTLL